MLSRKTWETAGFITIAAALHVSAAAYFVGEREEISLPPGPVTGSFSAGGGEIGEMIEKWESKPEAGATPEPAQPEPPQQESAPPQPQAQPEVSASRPNLPTPPMMKQEEIEEFEPPEIDLEPSLALAASARPERRPARPKPEPEPQREVQREAAPQPQRQQQAAPQPQRQAAPSGGGQGGGTGGGGGGGTGAAGGGGLSNSQKANLLGQWSGQVNNCIASATRNLTSSARRDGQAMVTVTASPSGALLGVSLSSSSGDARVDRDAIRAVQRVGRCPPAPAGITGSQTFAVPVTFRRR